MGKGKELRVRRETSFRRRSVNENSKSLFNLAAKFAKYPQSRVRETMLFTRLHSNSANHRTSD